LDELCSQREDNASTHLAVRKYGSQDWERGPEMLRLKTLIVGRCQVSMRKFPLLTTSPQNDQGAVSSSQYLDSAAEQMRPRS
jgi:hypothetical protein